ncbi:hypothetical protein R84981_002884 [Carnimonas sp. R-84981]|uniref:phage terminase large subunit n=1 Tax=Carnimonas bestiolae TaxID=3402172 RepID=UPI003EDC22A4
MVDWDDMPQRAKLAMKIQAEALKHQLDCAEELITDNTFLRQWFRLDQGQRFIPNWHHAYVARKFLEVITGQTTNLVVNQPPGSTKSEFWCIFMPALARVNFDRVRILTASFSQPLVQEHANRVKALFSSQEFSELWPCLWGRQSVHNFTILNERGKVQFQAFARSLSGPVTGARAGFMEEGKYTGHIMLDDPQKPIDMLSNVRRDKSNEILNSTIRSRRALPTTPVIIVQQRLHTDDASGFALRGGMGLDFDHVNIPALIDEQYIASLPDGIREMCWECVKDSPSRVVNGTRYWSYWPGKEDIDDLIRFWDRDNYTFMSQYMQRPQALTGGVFDSDWFQTYTELPPLSHRAVYVDTNSGKVEDYNDYTVFTLVGVGRDDGYLYVIDVVRGRWDPADLLKTARDLWKRWSVVNKKRPEPLRYMSIEDKQAGQGLITTLKKRRLRGDPEHVHVPVNEIPRGAGQNKLVRALNSVPQIKSGQVFMPATHDANGHPIEQVNYCDGRVAAKTNWVMTATTEFSDFAADDSHANDDVVDTIMDAIANELVENDNSPFSSWV